MRTLLCIGFLLSFMASPALSPAQYPGPKSPDSLSFQGQLTDAGGVPIDGVVPMTLKI